MKMNTSCSKSAFKSWRHQFAQSILGALYLSIQADLAPTLVDNVVELSKYSNFVNYTIS